MINVRIGEAIESKGNEWVTEMQPTNYNSETLKRVLMRKVLGMKIFDELEFDVSDYELRIKFTFDGPLNGDELDFELSNTQVLIGNDDDEKFIIVIPNSYQFDMDLHQYLEKKRQQKIERMKTTDVFMVGPRI